jgi:hypothetical protein
VGRGGVAPRRGTGQCAMVRVRVRVNAPLIAKEPTLSSLPPLSNLSPCTSKRAPAQRHPEPTLEAEAPRAGPSRRPAPTRRPAEAAATAGPGRPRLSLAAASSAAPAAPAPHGLVDGVTHDDLVQLLADGQHGRGRGLRREAPLLRLGVRRHANHLTPAPRRRVRCALPLVPTHRDLRHPCRPGWHGRETPRGTRSLHSLSLPRGITHREKDMFVDNDQNNSNEPTTCFNGNLQERRRGNGPPRRRSGRSSPRCESGRGSARISPRASPDSAPAASAPAPAPNGLESFEGTQQVLKHSTRCVHPPPPPYYCPYPCPYCILPPASCARFHLSRVGSAAVSQRKHHAARGGGRAGRAHVAPHVSN